jgi:hypothetical protein
MISLSILILVVLFGLSMLGLHSPFQKTLSSICQQVVVPNVLLRESDQELFEDNPEEYVRRDIEGSDHETRRRGATDLVNGLCRFFEGALHMPGTGHACHGKPCASLSAQNDTPKLTRYATSITGLTSAIMTSPSIILQCCD